MSLLDAKFGDILAFDGKGVGSSLINLMSGGNVSHVAFVLNENELIESTMLDDSDPQDGVNIKSIDDKLASYDGSVWHLSLKEEIVNEQECLRYAKSFEGFPYDLKQAAKSALDILLDNRENFNALFCSELCTAILKQGRIIKNGDVIPSFILPPTLNSSEVTPIDTCRIKIYQWCRCLTGSENIKRFNTIDIKDFDEY